MVFAFGALHRVVSAGPEGVLNGLGGKLMKGLAKELGTEVAPTDAETVCSPVRYSGYECLPCFAGLSHGVDDGSDAGEGDQFIGRLPATAI